MDSTAIFIVVFWATSAEALTCQTSVTEVSCRPGTEEHSLKRGVVSDNNATTSVALRACLISDVALESFSGLPALRRLDLSQNRLNSLRLGVLDGFRRLSYLNVSFNMLQRLPLGLFDQKRSLEVLDLSNNQLESVELGIFDELKKLSYVSLANNNILGVDFSIYVFDKSRVIRFVDFSGNDMFDTPDGLVHAFSELAVLRLSSCNLREVPDFALRDNLKTLTELTLSFNLIRTLENGTFKHLSSLTVLDLNSNRIEELQEDVFKPLSKLKRLVLRRNEIKHIEDGLFLNMKAMEHIDLSHNKIEQVPVNAFRGTALNSLNLANNKFTYLQDNFALELRNSGASLKTLYFQDNPWQCACLMQLLIEVKRFKIKYQNFKANSPACVTGDQFNCHRNPSSYSLYVDMYSNLGPAHVR